MASIIIRTAIIYVLLLFCMRVMGKRQIGELDVSELVSTLLISEIVSIPIDDTDIPLMNAVIAVLFLLSVEIITSTLKNKSQKMKKVFEGSPTYIIYKGKLLQSALKENRISVDELLSEMRSQGITDINDVYYGIVEQNGSLSLIKKSDNAMAHAVIIDGEIIENTLSAQKISQDKILSLLKAHSLDVEDVFLLTMSDNGSINLIPKEKNEGKSIRNLHLHNHRRIRHHKLGASKQKHR